MGQGRSRREDRYGSLEGKYRLQDGDAAAYTFAVGEKTYSPDLADNGLYYVEVSDINPQDYQTNIQLTVSDGTSDLTVSYSPMHYISRMHGKTDNAELKALMCVMYGYHQTAISYLEDPYGNNNDNVVSAQ